MIEKLNNDLDIIKSYFTHKNIDVVIDGYYENDDSLDSIKGLKKIACVKENSISSKKYENVICSNPLEKIKDKSANCIIFRKAIDKISNVEEFIKTCATKIDNEGYFILSNTITDKEDAFLNTLSYEKDNSHIRFYTVKEILDFTSSFFKLEYYQEVEEVISINTWLDNSSMNINEATVKFQKFPENIKKDLKLTFNNLGEVSFISLKTGLFIFKLL